MCTRLFKKQSCSPLYRIAIMGPSSLVFQDDNDPKHMSKDCVRMVGITTISTPSMAYIISGC